MKHLFLIAALFLFAGCVKNTTPPVGIPKAVVVQESAKPSHEKTQKFIDASIEESIKIKEGVKNHKIALENQGKNISVAIEKGEKIRNKVLSGEVIESSEVHFLLNELRIIQLKNIVLQDDANNLLKTIESQKQLLGGANLTAKETMAKLILKEAEAKEIRAQAEFLAHNLDLKNKEVIAASKEKEKLIKQKADAMVYKKMFWYAIAAFLGWIVVKNILMVYFPYTKFRI